MDRPAPALIGSLAVHAAVVGLAVLGMLNFARTEPMKIVQSVPVSIVSDRLVVEAAAADNPSEELVTEDAATAPVAPPPEPVPPAPTPAPPLRPPTPVPAKKAPTPRPTPPTPTPPKAAATPPRTAPPRREPALDLDSLAGPARPATRPGTRPRTGQQGQGAAPRAIGRGDLSALAAQITPHWNLPCDLPGADDLTIGVRVTLSESGGVVGAPRLAQSRSDPVWRAASDGVLRAIRAAAPFDMPAGYEQQEIAFSFRTATMCANR